MSVVSKHRRLLGRSVLMAACNRSRVFDLAFGFTCRARKCSGAGREGPPVTATLAQTFGYLVGAVLDVLGISFDVADPRCIKEVACTMADRKRLIRTLLIPKVLRTYGVKVFLQDTLACVAVELLSWDADPIFASPGLSGLLAPPFKSCSAWGDLLHLKAAVSRGWRLCDWTDAFTPENFQNRRFLDGTNGQFGVMERIMSALERALQPQAGSEGLIASFDAAVNADSEDAVVDLFAVKTAGPSSDMQVWAICSLVMPTSRLIRFVTPRQIAGNHAADELAKRGIGYDRAQKKGCRGPSCVVGAAMDDFFMGYASGERAAALRRAGARVFVPPRRRTGNGGSDQGLLDESLDDDALFDRLHGHREQENGTRDLHGTVGGLPRLQKVWVLTYGSAMLPDRGFVKAKAPSAARSEQASCVLRRTAHERYHCKDEWQALKKKPGLLLRSWVSRTDEKLAKRFLDTWGRELKDNTEVQGLLRLPVSVATQLSLQLDWETAVETALSAELQRQRQARLIGGGDDLPPGQRSHGLASTL
ncbi:unnamed protein product [Symbiodinium microadriaticum]|nr:unnamed protein product [Symbiodinium microadriaticum]